MSLRGLWILSSLLALACASLSPQPKLEPLDCLARSDCIVVKVDNNGGQFAGIVRINGYTLGEVDSYKATIFSLYTNQLRNGNCAYVYIRFINAPYTKPLQSTEQCIVRGQYYQVDITNAQRAIWLTPFRINDNVTR